MDSGEMGEVGGERGRRRGERGGEAEAGIAIGEVQIGRRGEEEVGKGMKKEAETGGRGEVGGEEAGALREGEREMRRPPPQVGMELQFLRSTRMQSERERISSVNLSKNFQPWRQ